MLISRWIFSMNSTTLIYLYLQQFRLVEYIYKSCLSIDISIHLTLTPKKASYYHHLLALDHLQLPQLERYIC